MLKNNTVLIVDDEKDLRKVLTEYCRNLHCFKQITCAEDGAIAIQKLRKQKFDLIILDLSLPKKDGVNVLKDLCNDMQKLNKSKDIIVITGYLEKEVADSLILNGINKILLKPFDEKSFADKVSKVINLT